MACEIDITLTNNCGTNVIPQVLTIADAQITDDRDGDNWDIRAGVDERTSNSGLAWISQQNGQYTLMTNRANDVHSVPGGGAVYTEPRYAAIVHVFWGQTEPTEGNYDFVTEDNQVNAINALPSGAAFTIWPHYYGGASIPNWVDTKHGTDFQGSPDDYWKQTAIAPYTFMFEFEKWLDQVAQRYATHPRLAYIDMRVPWSFANGEWTIPGGLPGGSTNAEVEAFQNYFHDRFKKVWVDDNGGNPDHLVMMVGLRAFNGLQVVDYGKTKSYGHRSGKPSRANHWEVYENCNLVNNRVVYDELNHSFGRLIGAVSYDEATEVQLHSPVPPGWPQPDEAYETWLYMILWSLAQRRRWMAIPPQFYQVAGSSYYNGLTAQVQYDFDKIQELMRWIEVSLGHLPETATIGYSYLSSAIMGGGSTTAFWCNNNPAGNAVTVENFAERWVYQQEVAGDGVTVNALPIGANELTQDRRSATQDVWKARSFDQNMYFLVEPLYLTGGPHDVEVRVTYYDLINTTFDLEYSLGSGQTFATPVHSSTGGGSAFSEYRTVTFELCGCYFDQAFSGKDFRLRKQGGDDPIIRMVQVLKL